MNQRSFAAPERRCRLLVEGWPDALTPASLHPDRAVFSRAASQ